jgi:MscS family membrane protein
LVPVVVGAFFVDEYLAPAGAYANIGDMFVRSLVAFNIFWILYRAVEPLKFVLAGIEKIFTPAIAEWLIKAIKVLIAFIGAATILEIWGIQVGPILAGLGLVGVAVALGAQDLFRNLIAGILVLAERRFSQGDWILVDGVVEGIVESIGFRSSVIRRFDKAPVFVPNSKLSDNSLTNFSQMTHRRIYWMIGVEYRTTVDQLRQIRDQIEAYVIDGDEFANPSDVATFVRIDRFGDSSIDIMLYCFTRTTNWGEWLEIKERLAYRIKDIVEGAGTGFAFPSRSVYVETVPYGTPEPFVPPETRDADA